MSSSNGGRLPTWMHSRPIFPSVVAVVVAGVALLSACSDTPTAVKQTDTLDGAAVLLAAQVTSDVRQFTPKGTVITHDVRSVNSVQKGDMFGWQAHAQADSHVPVQALVGVGPLVERVGSNPSTALSPTIPLPALDRFGPTGLGKRFSGRHEIVSHRDPHSGHVISVATLHDDDESPGSPARQMFVFVDGKPRIVMGMRHAWRGGHWAPKKIHIVAFDSTGSPRAEVNQTWNFADSAVAFLDAPSGKVRNSVAFASVKRILRATESFAESTFLPDEVEAQGGFANPWGFDDGWYQGGLHDQGGPCDQILSHYNFVLANLFVEGYGTTFEVADCGEAILAAIVSGGALSPAAALVCGVTAFTTGYYIYELWELNQLQAELTQCRHTNGIADNSGGSSGSYWSVDGTQSVDFTALNASIETFVAEYGSGWQCTADGQYCIDIVAQA